MGFFKFLMMLITLNVQAIELNAVIRKGKNNKSEVGRVHISDLIGNSFETKDFKVVLDKNEDAVSLDYPDLNVRLKAATVLFHLIKARRFFTDKLESEYVKNLDQVVIRIEIKNKHHSLGHFAHDKNEPQFNNAKSIPAGQGYEPKGIKPWGSEIWFRPAKKIHLSDLMSSDVEQAEYQGVLSSFRRQIHIQTLNRYFVSKLRGNAFPQGFNIDSVIRTFGASLFLEFGYQNIDGLNNLLSRKWYHLESALVPEIIYHEFAHIALADHLELTHSTPVNEGLADFFAGKIADNEKLATQIKKYNTFNGKNAKNKSKYRLQFEQTGYANTDFVFGMLWSLESILGDNVSNFVYKMRENLTTNSNVRSDLINVIEDTCYEDCARGYLDVVEIKKHFHFKGI